MTKGTLAGLDPIEAALKQRFLPVLFGEGKVTAELRALTQLPIKASGMVLPNPTSIDPQAYATTARAVQDLTVALMGDTAFCADQHAAEAQQERSHAHKTARWTALSESDTLIVPLLLKAKCTLLRIRETGVWLSYAPMAIAGNKLPVVE